MLKTGILNPSLASLIARVRHTNTILVADRGFPFFPHVETVDIALVATGCAVESDHSPMVCDAGRFGTRASIAGAALRRCRRGVGGSHAER